MSENSFELLLRIGRRDRKATVFAFPAKEFILGIFFIHTLYRDNGELEYPVLKSDSSKKGSGPFITLS